MEKFVAAIDCGTSVIKTAIFDLNGRIRSSAKIECPCIYHKDGHIEQNPESIIAQTFACLKKTILRSRINPKNILSVAISSQRATVICIDKNGRAIGNAISWQDMRGKEEAAAFRRKIDDKTYYAVTGIPNNPVFSLAKVLWIKKHAPLLYRRTKQIVLIHDYVAKNLGCDSFYEDWSNASLTGMFDVARFTWSADILHAAGIRGERLPHLVPSGKKIGVVSKYASQRSGLSEGTPIISGGGDQQCAGLGCGAVKEGVAEITLGTAGVSLSYAKRVIRDPKRRISCCAHAVPGAWEVEGLQNSAGASLDWIKKIIFDDTNFSKQFFARVSSVKPGSGGILYYPYLSGASAPHWNPLAKAMFLGLNHSHDKPSIVRAVMEGVSMETRQVLEVFESVGISVGEIRLAGGCSYIDTWNQIQADIYNRDVSILENPEASLGGAALLAAYGIGCFPSIEDAAESMVRLKRTYKPIPKNVEAYGKMYRRFSDVYTYLEKNNAFKLMA